MPTDITPRNDKGQAHGLWVTYYSNGQLDFKGEYINDYRHGFWEAYLYSGELAFKGHYHMNNPVGYWCHFKTKIFYAD